MPAKAAAIATAPGSAVAAVNSPALVRLKVSDTVAILHWTQFRGTPQQVSGEDVFITKNGKIATQWIGAGAPDAPKPAKGNGPSPKK